MASATAAASVPNVVASSPAATSIDGRSADSTISLARPTAASASARLCETTTMPITTRRLRRTPATSWCSSLRGLGVPRFAHPGSWPVPCGLPSGIVSSRPFAAAAAAASRAATRDRREAARVVRLQRPGPRRRPWSCRRPRPCPGRRCPRTRRASAAPSSAADASSTPCSALPNRRKNVPYSGPLAPPTVLTRVIPTFLNSASADSNCVASIAATTASCPGPCCCRGRRRRWRSRARSGSGRCRGRTSRMPAATQRKRRP